MRGDLHARLQPLPDLLAGHQGLTFAPLAVVPPVVAADAVADHVTGRRASVAPQQGQSRGQGVQVSVVERQDHPAVRRAAIEVREPFGHRHPPPPEPPQRPELPFQLRLRDVQQRKQRATAGAAPILW